MYFPWQVSVSYACKRNIALHICKWISLSRKIALFYSNSDVNADKKDSETKKTGEDNKITVMLEAEYQAGSYWA